MKHYIITVLALNIPHILPTVTKSIAKVFAIFHCLLYYTRPRGNLDPQPTPWSPPAASGLNQAMLSNNALPMREASGT